LPEEAEEATTEEAPAKDQKETYHIINSNITIEESNRPQLLHIFKNHDAERVLCGAKLGIHWEELENSFYNKIDKTKIQDILKHFDKFGTCKNCLRSLKKIAAEKSKTPQTPPAEEAAGEEELYFSYSYRPTGNNPIKSGYIQAKNIYQAEGKVEDFADFQNMITLS